MASSCHQNNHRDWLRVCIALDPRQTHFTWVGTRIGYPFLQSLVWACCRGHDIGVTMECGATRECICWHQDCVWMSASWRCNNISNITSVQLLSLQLNVASVRWDVSGDESNETTISVYLERSPSTLGSLFWERRNNYWVAWSLMMPVLNNKCSNS